MKLVMGLNRAPEWLSRLGARSLKLFVGGRLWDVIARRRLTYSRV